MRSRKPDKNLLTSRDIVLAGMMVAIIEVCKGAMAALPNIELTSFWIIVFTLFFEWKIIFVIFAFIFMEGVLYPFGLWWVMYLYAWPLLAFLTWLFRRQSSVWFWCVLSALFGLSFGFLCSLPYAAIGMADGGLFQGLTAAFTWWVAGIPWDMVHGGGNFIVMLVL